MTATSSVSEVSLLARPRTGWLAGGDSAYCLIPPLLPQISIFFLLLHLSPSHFSHPSLLGRASVGASPARERSHFDRLRLGLRRPRRSALTAITASWRRAKHQGPAPPRPWTTRFVRVGREGSYCGWTSNLARRVPLGQAALDHYNPPCKKGGSPSASRKSGVSPIPPAGSCVPSSPGRKQIRPFSAQPLRLPGPEREGHRGDQQPPPSSQRGGGRSGARRGTVRRWKKKGGALTTRVG